MPGVLILSPRQNIDLLPFLCYRVYTSKKTKNENAAGPRKPTVRGSLMDRHRDRSLGRAALGRPDIAEVLPGVSGDAEASSTVLGGAPILG